MSQFDSSGLFRRLAKIRSLRGETRLKLLVMGYWLLVSGTGWVVA